MKRLLRATLAAAALIPALLTAPNGAVEAPPHLAQALSEQRNLTREHPNDAGVWNDLGNLLVLSGDLDEAESAYDAALAIEPGRTTTRFNLALLRQQRGDIGAAIADYLALLEDDPGNAQAQYQLGAAYESQGQRQLAIQRYAEAFTLDPDLLFAENNPHIIENGLVTEALLQARRGRRVGPQVARTYDQPARITSILVPPPPAPPAEESAEDADDGNGAGPPAAARQESRLRTETSRGGEGSPQSTESAAYAIPKDRVLDSSDLRGGASNQVKGDAASPVATRRRAASSVNPTAARRPALIQPPASQVEGFGIGARSTGSLEWNLGPKNAPPEVRSSAPTLSAREGVG